MTSVRRLALGATLALACFDCGARSQLDGGELERSTASGTSGSSSGPSDGQGGFGAVSGKGGSGAGAPAPGGTSASGGIGAQGGTGGASDGGQAGPVEIGGEGGDGGDPGASGEGGVAGTDTEPECGNQVIDAGEACDDGNQTSGDGCKQCVGIAALVAGQGVTCAMLSDGSIRCWGAGGYGLLGQGTGESAGDAPGEMGDALPSMDLGATSPQVITASYHACALFDGGSVKCWGSNYQGATGLGKSSGAEGEEPGEMGSTLPFVDVGGVVVGLDAGGYHTCALLEGGEVKCWGDNALGQLGLGDGTDRGESPGEMGDQLPVVELGAKAVSISAGLFHTCALLEGGTVKCWGNNGNGQLGQGDLVRRGMQPLQMGEHLPAIDLGGTALAVSVGYYHTCALLDGGTVKCWGSNYYAQLGLGDTDDRGDEPFEMGESLPAVDLGGKVIALGAGAIHTCALLEDGTVKCWGNNDDGRLGLGDLNTRGDEPGEMGANLPAVDLGATPATALEVGVTHQCVRFDTGLVKCWGSNWGGGLGLGDTDLRGDEANEMGEALPFTPVP